jgi:hypothetical protein
MCPCKAGFDWTHPIPFIYGSKRKKLAESFIVLVFSAFSAPIFYAVGAITSPPAMVIPHRFDPNQ